MILTFELEPELERLLENDAKQKHVSPSEIVKNFLIQNYFNQKKATESLTDDEQNTQQLLERIKNIKRVTAPYSSEILVRELRHEKTISPITQSLIGLLANSNLDETDYKQEVLDFALFLLQREEAREWQNLMLAQTESLSDWDNAEDEVWTNAEFTEMAMNQAMRGMEDESALYTLDDLKERWQ